jgi:hypothetical protein
MGATRLHRFRRGKGETRAQSAHRAAVAVARIGAPASGHADANAKVAMDWRKRMRWPILGLKSLFPWSDGLMAWRRERRGGEDFRVYVGTMMKEGISRPLKEAMVGMTRTWRVS